MTKPTKLPPRRKAGRPPELEEWERVHLVLTRKQLDYLGQLSISFACSENGWQPLGRSEVVRVILDAMQKSGTTLAGCATEESAVATLASKLKSR
jgi:hypothetical protein